MGGSINSIKREPKMTTRNFEVTRMPLVAFAWEVMLDEDSSTGVDVIILSPSWHDVLTAAVYDATSLQYGNLYVMLECQRSGDLWLRILIFHGSSYNVMFCPVLPSSHLFLGIKAR